MLIQVIAFLFIFKGVEIAKTIRRRQELFSVKLRKQDRNFTKNTKYVNTVPFDQYCSNVYRSYCYGKKLYYSSSITTSSSSTTTTKSKFSTTSSLSSLSSSKTVTSGRQEEGGGGGFFHMMSKISSVNEFIYQGLENSIQLELGTLQQDVMRSRTRSLSTITTNFSSKIRRDDDDDDDVIGRDKQKNKRIDRIRIRF